MVVLLSDGLDSLFPGLFDTLTLRIMSFIILTPMLFFPVRYLSYSSLLGIISAVSIIIVMLVDGFSKRDAPGSLWEPAASGQMNAAKLIFFMQLTKSYVGYRNLAIRLDDSATKLWSYHGRICGTCRVSYSPPRYGKPKALRDNGESDVLGNNYSLLWRGCMWLSHVWLTDHAGGKRFIFLLILRRWCAHELLISHHNVIRSHKISSWCLNTTRS